MKKFSEVYKELYYDKMKQPAGNNPIRDRSEGFLKIFEMLEEVNYPLIVETGCMRPDHGIFSFGDDGASSFLFDEFLSCRFGVGMSFDINNENIEHARLVAGKNMQYYCRDSVISLRELAEDEDNVCSLLYLDSFDCELSNPLPSQVHQLKEIAAAMPMLRKGSIVASDDYLLPDGSIGKGKFLKQFLDNIGATLVVEGYMLVYVL